MQAMIGTISLGLGLFFVASFLARLPGLAYLGAISHLFTVIWLSGIGYAIAKHKLMIISPAEAAYSIYTTMADGVLLLDGEGRIVNANPATCEILRLRESDLLTHRVDEAIPGVFTSESLKADSGGIVRDREALYSTSSGPVTYLSFSASPLKDEEGKVGGTVVVFRDITERKQTEKRFLHMATHDALTNLPNRVLLNDRLRNAISHAEPSITSFAVLLIDFGQIQGHQRPPRAQRRGPRAHRGRRGSSSCLPTRIRHRQPLWAGTSSWSCSRTWWLNGSYDTVIKRIWAAFAATVNIECLRAY